MHVQRVGVGAGTRTGRLLLAAVLAAGPARALINPHFTPADLVRASARILVTEATRAADGRLALRVVEVLRGDAPAGRVLHVTLGPSVAERAFGEVWGERDTVPAVVVMHAREDDGGGEAPPDAILLRAQWFALHKAGEGLVLEADERDLYSVWAGSAPMLAEAARYVQADPRAAFPVRADLEWTDEVSLGTWTGTVYGCTEVDLGAPHGVGVVVACSGGDRLVRSAAKAGGRPEDVTAAAGLTTRSRRLAAGDFNGDGRMDLASWDGASLRVASQREGGTFAAPVTLCALPACTWLEPVGLAGGGTGLLAGGGGGGGGAPTLVRPGAGAGAVATGLRPTAGAPAAGAGEDGCGVVADVDGDGREDVLECFSQGVVWRAGDAAGGFGPPAVLRVGLVKQPCAAFCGDVDGDGRLDVVVGGADGIALLVRNGAGTWENLLTATGELAYHGNAGQPALSALSGCDVNSDGRPGAALFYRDRKPMLFFNRGFACFGWARELDAEAGAEGVGEDEFEVPGEEEEEEEARAALEGWTALQAGQAAGTVLDLNADGFPDLFAVASATGQGWALFGGRPGEGEPRRLELRAPASMAGSRTVTLRAGGRFAGMAVVRPGRMVTVARPYAGPVRVEYRTPEGREVKRTVMVMKGRVSVELE